MKGEDEHGVCRRSAVEVDVDSQNGESQKVPGRTHRLCRAGIALCLWLPLVPGKSRLLDALFSQLAANSLLSSNILSKVERLSSLLKPCLVCIPNLPYLFQYKLLGYGTPMFEFYY